MTEILDDDDKRMNEFENETKEGKETQELVDYIVIFEKGEKKTTVDNNRQQSTTIDDK